MDHGVFATTHGPTKKFTQAFRTVENVILIFSVSESSCFQGIARMESGPDPNLKPGLIQKTGGNLKYIEFMNNFKVRWLM